jgi:hypothetical protein
MSADKPIEVVVRVEDLEFIDRNGDEVTIVEEEVIEITTGENSKEADVSVQLYGDPEHHRKHFLVSHETVLLGVLDEGSRQLDVKLLPSAEHPLDVLRGVYSDQRTGAPLNLDLTLAEFLREKPATFHFAVELVLAIQINTRWRVAPEQQMTPRAILLLASLSPDEYSLYFPCESKVPLPPDTPIHLHRGQRFEAQRDGKYGHRGECGGSR